MYGLKINDHQLFFPQAYGTEVSYFPSLDLSADDLSHQAHIPGIGVGQGVLAHCSPWGHKESGTTEQLN